MTFKYGYHNRSIQRNYEISVLGFMHQPDEPKSLNSWEEVGNPLILHNTPTHAAGTRRKCGNKEGSGGLKRCLYQDSNSRPLALIPC